MGEAAMDCMLQLLNGKSAESQRLIADLVVRESTSQARLLRHSAKKPLSHSDARTTL
jgi:hypothetical protein